MNKFPFPEPPNMGINTWVLEAFHWCRREGLSIVEATQRITGYEGTLRRPLKRSEVKRAAEHAYSAKLDKSVHIERKVELPPWNSQETARIFEASGTTVVDLTVLSPLADPQMIPTREILATLFPDADGLLCVGKSAFSFKTAPLRDHKFLVQSQFIVPAYMSAKTGLTQDGKVSAHTKENTGTRRYIVCDFDKPPPDQHAAITSKIKPLAITSKSLGSRLSAILKNSVPR